MTIAAYGSCEAGNLYINGDYAGNALYGTHATTELSIEEVSV